MKAFLAGLMFVCTSVHAGVYENGNTLLRDLEGTNMERMYALGYIVGTADAYGGEAICVPQTVTKGQLNDVVYRFLKINPQHRDFSADVLVLLSLVEHWPGAKKEKGRSQS
jgi:hypothetical protein